MSKKNLVLGTAIGYDLQDLQSFVGSFREVNVVDDMVLISESNINPDLESFLKEKNIKTLNFNSHLFFETLIHNSRYILYLDFLLEKDYKQILLTDTRDVIFQSNPFVHREEDFLFLFLEDSSALIGNCRLNSYWVESAYGNLGREHLFPQKIICCGTILGSRSQIIKYLEKYKKELLEIRSRSSNVYSKSAVDQAIANYIGYLDNQDLRLTIKPNGDLVGTIGHSMCLSSGQDIVIFDLGKIQVNGSEPAVIHQYDRHPKLLDYYAMKYLEKLNLTSSIK